MVLLYVVKVHYGVGQVHLFEARSLHEAQGLVADIFERGLRLVFDDGVEELYPPRQVSRVVLEPKP